MSKSTKKTPQRKKPKQPTSGPVLKEWRLTCHYLRPYSGEVLVVFIVGLLLSLAMQGHGQAFQAEFGGHPDEAGHYVTGLMIRDYLAAGCPEQPMRYAKTYYAHYPKVALGHWPPGFYLLQAGWTLLFSPSRMMMMVLMAALSAVLGSIVYFLVRAEGGGRIAAGTAGIMLLGLPLVQRYDSMVMTEIPMAIWCLLAAAAFGRYLRTESWVDSALFGFLAAAAILTKGTGAGLALLPPFALLLSRRFFLLRRYSFWLPAVIVLILCGPWTLATLKLVQNGWEQSSPSWGFTRRALPYYSLALFHAIGWFVLLLSVGGLWERRLNRKKDAGLWIALTALIAALFTFHLLIPCGYEARHLIPLLGTVLVFAGTGLHSWSKLATKGRWNEKQAALAVAAVSLFFYGITVFRLSDRHYAGFVPIVQEILLSNPVQPILVSSDARGEGMMIAATAERDPHRPGYTVLRASKLFASSSWSGGGYRESVTTPMELIAILRKNGIGWVVEDTSIPAEKFVAHHRLLAETIATHPSLFKEVRRFPIVRDGQQQAEALRLYLFDINMRHLEQKTGKRPKSSPPPADQDGRE